MLLTALFYLFIAVVCIQILFFLFFLKPFSKKDPVQVFEKPVSVLIAARNEAENLRMNLPAILEQHYTHFEVIVVDDGSTDATPTVLEQFCGIYTHLRILTRKDSQGHKKKALAQAIAAAKYEHLLFTDADCSPATPYWIARMVKGFADNKSIVLGYGAYHTQGGSWLNKLIRYETQLTTLQYFAYATWGIPYMGVGRNLGYTKEIYKASGGFEAHMNIRSGDDDLFINASATKSNTATCLSKEGMTLSEPNTTFAAWFHQKRRHITTANHYRPLHQFLLGIFYISQLLFWPLAITLLFFSFTWQTVLLLVMIRTGLQYVAFARFGNHFKETDLIVLIPVLDVSLVLVQLALFCANIFSKPKNW